MSDIKKARFPSEALPPINSETSGYIFRFRVVSQDKNRKSAWSSIYSLVPDYTYDIGDIGHSTSGNILSISWDPVRLLIDDSFITNVAGYDIWVNWNNSSWEYRESTTSTSFSFVIPSGSTSYAVKVYRRMTPPKQVNALELYSVPNTTI